MGNRVPVWQVGALCAAFPRGIFPLQILRAQPRPGCTSRRGDGETRGLRARCPLPVPAVCLPILAAAHLHGGEPWVCAADVSTSSKGLLWDSGFQETFTGAKHLFSGSSEKRGMGVGSEASSPSGGSSTTLPFRKQMFSQAQSGCTPNPGITGVRDTQDFCPFATSGRVTLTVLGNL